MKNTDTEIRQLAEEHVEWLIAFIVPIIRRVGIEEFIHGYKHGRDDTKKENDNDNKQSN